MEMEITKQVKEKVKVALPCFLYNRNTGRYSKITVDANIVIVAVGFLCVYDHNGINAKNEIRDALREGEPCTEKDFEHALKTQINYIKTIS